VAARILVVEDNPTNLSLMDYLLRAFGYDVLTAADGVEGVDAARRQSPDVILMDLQMPKLNGYEAAAEIRAIPALRKIALLAVTAFAMVGDCDKILARGFDGYIAKPISPDTFVREVEAFVPLHLRSAKRAEASLLRKEPGAGRTNPRY
jgi:CheY-like chemotaxis protein